MKVKIEAHTRKQQAPPYTMRLGVDDLNLLAQLAARTGRTKHATARDLLRQALKQAQQQGRIEA